MAVRQATLDLRALREFLQVWQGSIAQATVVIPAGTVAGELAPEFKLDLLLPLIGRVGPVVCQIIQRMPDGGIAARIPELPSKVEKSGQQVLDFIAEVAAHLQSSGAVPGSGAPAAGEGSLGGDGGAGPEPGVPVPEAPGSPQIEGQAPGGAAAEAASAEPGPAPHGGAGTAEAASDSPPEPAAAVAVQPAAEPTPPPPTVQELLALAEPAEPRGPVERGLKVPNLEGITPTISGLLGDRSLRGALLALGAQAATGVLLITTLEEVTRWGFWQQGGPVGWRAEPAQESEQLGALLRQAGHPPAEVLGQADRLMASRGWRLGEALLALGAITEEQREALLQRQSEHILKRVLALREGTWAFYTLDSLPDRFDCAPVSVPTFVYRAVQSHALGLPPASVFGAIKARGRMFASVRAEAQELITSVAWTRPEADLLAAMRRKPERLESLITGQGPGELRLAATLLAMGELGVMEFTKLPGQRLSSQADLEQRVAQRAPRAASDNHFDRMELHWICTQEEVDERFRRLLQEFDVSAFPEAPDPLKADIEALLNGIKEAYNVLKTGDDRRAYRAQTIEPELVQGALAELRRRAQGCMDRGDRGAAQGLWARALELSPHDVELQQGLAACASKKG